MKVGAYSISLPIVRAKSSLDPKYVLLDGEIEGSCFSIGGKFLMTAGHVVNSVLKSGDDTYIGLRNPITDESISVRITNHESLDLDLGIIEIEDDVNIYDGLITTFCWMEGYLNALDNVLCYGFPHGLLNVKNKKQFLQRGFKGYIVSAPWEYELLGFRHDPFLAYELSFRVDRGLSGAPLLYEVADRGKIIAGVIIGNSDQKILVSKSEEREEIDCNVKIIELYDNLSLGIAIRGNSIFNSLSGLLGCTIGEHLSKHNLLVDIK